MIFTLIDRKAATFKLVFDGDPKNVFHYALYETMLEGDKDLGMFPVVRGSKRGDPTPPRITMRQSSDGEWIGKVTQRGVTTTIAAKAENDTVVVRYEVASTRKASRLQIHPCLMTTYAPDWIGKRKGSSDYREMGTRIFLACPRRTSLAKLGGDKHQAVSAADGWAAKWAWWVYSKTRFTKPVSELHRRTGKMHMTFDSTDGTGTTHISANMGDSRSCKHWFPKVGDLKAGETRIVSLRIRLLKG